LAMRTAGQARPGSASAPCRLFFRQLSRSDAPSRPLVRH
jgi:hypothetical protein